MKEFREEQGEIEFTTDGTCVNTMDGWREMPPSAVDLGRLFSKRGFDNNEPPRRFKPVSPVGIFSKRDLAATALPEEWDSRALPAPKVRVAFSATPKEEQQKSDDFGRRWKAWRNQRLIVLSAACAGRHQKSE